MTLRTNILKKKIEAELNSTITCVFLKLVDMIERFFL